MYEVYKLQTHLQLLGQVFCEEDIRIRIYLLSVKSIEQRTVPEGKLESFTKFAGNRRPTFLARSFVTRGHHYRQQPPLIYYGNFSTDTTNI